MKAIAYTLDIAALQRMRNARIKLEAAKQWLRDNGGAHPGCLDRFMKARGLA